MVGEVGFINKKMIIFLIGLPLGLSLIAAWQLARMPDLDSNLTWLPLSLAWTGLALGLIALGLGLPRGLKPEHLARELDRYRQAALARSELGRRESALKSGDF